MPRLSEAKKDVISCDKLWRGANNRQPADFRIGQPIYPDKGSKPAELKHLSKRRNIKRNRFP